MYPQKVFIPTLRKLLLLAPFTLIVSGGILWNSVLAQTGTPQMAAGRVQQDCQTNLQQQQYLAALAPCKQAVEEFRKLGDRPRFAEALYRLGTAYEAVSRSWEAIDVYKQAEALYRELNDTKGQANALIGLGDAYRGRSQYEWAIDYYQQAYSLQVANNNISGQARALMNLGVVYQALSNYQVAINFSEDALSRLYAANDRPGQAEGLINLGNLYQELGRSEQAIKHYQDALPIVLSEQDRKGEAEALMSLGNVHSGMFQHQQAIKLYQQALPLFLSVNDRIGEATVLLHLGNTYQLLGQFDAAMNSHQKAVRFFREIDNRNGEADALHGLGLIYSQQSQSQLAIDHFQQAIAIYRSIGDRAGQAIALGSLGEAYRKRGELDKADTYLRQSIELLESIRSRVKADRNRVSLFETYRSPYASLQQVLLAQKQPLPALEISERGRARAFVALLADRIASDSSSNGGTGASSAATSSIALNSITIAEIQQVAKEQNATLVEYSIIGNHTLYIWVVKPTGEIVFTEVSLKTLPAADSRSGLATLIDQSRAEDLGARGRGITFVETLESSSLVAAQVIPKQRDGHRHLNQLHQLLIEPIAPHLPSDPSQQVIFIPQGELFFVPFPALKTADGKFLINQHTITTVPAIQVLQLTRQQRLRLASSQPPSSSSPRLFSPSSALIVGNPTMPQIGEPPAQLTSLKGAEEEAKAIAKLLNTQPLIGPQATKTAVVKRMRSARLIHLATHGLLDDYKGLGIPGAVALAPDKRPEERLVHGRAREIDGLLTAGEILDLKLTAELVVLSACDTGRGRITGDGVIGLSRSLISAGAPSVLVSLWKVPDDSTSFLMQAFYENLEQGMDKAQALRQAMLTTKDQFPEPRDWAAFTLIGEAE